MSGQDIKHRTVLPIPDRPRTGLITYDAKDPETKYPAIEQLRPPKGAPNILVILLDDAGFGSSSALGGPYRTPSVLRTTARNAASMLSGAQIASIRCAVDAGLSVSAVAVTASTSCTSRRGASPRPGIGKANSSWYGGRVAVMRRPIYSPFPLPPSRG